MRTDFAQLRRLPDLLFPRRCPFCGSLLGPDALQGTVCPVCVPEEMRLQHIPARLPEGEHDFYAVREAAAAYYYEDIVRTAVLRCKRGGCFWYARELADRVAVLVFGALPAKQPGKMPQYAGVTALPLYSCIVPVPPRQPLPGMPGLPLLLALALAFYCLWRAQARGDTRPAAKHLYTATGFAVLTLVLSLHAFPWDFVEGWFGPAVGKVVGMFQFPFRFLSLGTLLLCVAALFALQLLPERRAALAAAGLVCAALLTASITETNIMSAQGCLLYTSDAADEL